MADCNTDWLGCARADDPTDPALADPLTAAADVVLLVTIEDTPPVKPTPGDDVDAPPAPDAVGSVLDTKVETGAPFVATGEAAALDAGEPVLAMPDARAAGDALDPAAPTIPAPAVDVTQLPADVADCDTDWLGCARADDPTDPALADGLVVVIIVFSELWIVSSFCPDANELEMLAKADSAAEGLIVFRTGVLDQDVVPILFEDIEFVVGKFIPDEYHEFEGVGKAGTVLGDTEPSIKNPIVSRFCSSHCKSRLDAIKFRIYVLLDKINTDTSIISINDRVWVKFCIRTIF